MRRIALTTILLATTLTMTACPKPPPDEPVPADPCKKEGQACAGPVEGPPQIGKHSPPPK